MVNHASAWGSEPPIRTRLQIKISIDMCAPSLLTCATIGQTAGYGARLRFIRSPRRRPRAGFVEW
jgi:hypothetical protein